MTYVDTRLSTFKTLEQISLGRVRLGELLGSALACGSGIGLRSGTLKTSREFAARELEVVGRPKHHSPIFREARELVRLT